MAGPQFHETGYGRRFFEAQLPQLIQALQELGQQTARQNVLMERMIQQEDEKSAVAGPDDIDGIPGLKLKNINIDTLMTGRTGIPIGEICNLADAFRPQMDTDRLIVGDPVIVKAKGITGHDAHLGWVKSVNKEDQIMKIEFCESEPGVQLRDRWVPFECVEDDPFRKNKNCTE